MEYSYQFSEELQQEWEWTERYATQPEILRYANHVADRFDLRRDIQFDTRVLSGRFDEDAGRWTVARPTAASSSVLGSSSWRPAACRRRTSPTFPGATRSRARRYHTGRWPHDGVDFTGQRVGVIGTGSSAIQSIPIIAEAGRAAHRVPAHRELLGAGAQRAARPPSSRVRSRPTTPAFAPGTA